MILSSPAAANTAWLVQMAIHAIGDRAVDEVLALLRDVAANNTGRLAERRHRVEHAQHLAGPEVGQSCNGYCRLTFTGMSKFN